MRIDNVTKTRAVKNKEICMKLINSGFELLNITKSRDNAQLTVYIFEDSSKFKVAFDEILKSLPKHKNENALLDFEKKYVVDMLEIKKNEYSKIGVKTDTINNIILKLSDEKSVDKKSSDSKSDVKKDEDGNFILDNIEPQYKFINISNAQKALYDFGQKNITPSIYRGNN